MSENVKAKVLIVDDNKSVCQLYKAMLDSQGYESKSAEDGKSALILMGQEYFDLVLLDIMMPQMDGLHILSLIKSDPKLSRSKVIMLTALSDDRIRGEADKFGACDFIVKSESDMKEVLKKIDRALSRS